MAEFPLLPIPNPDPDRRPSGSGGGSNLRLPDRARQGQRLQPVFQRLRNVFDEGRDPLTLREDPAGIAPERALVLEVAGTIDEFHNAARLVPGLELLGDEETEFEADADFAVRDTRKGREGEDRLDKPVGGRLYLAMPDTQALRELVRLWDRYQAGQTAETGFGPWIHVFRHLYRIRVWGPTDRIPEETISYFTRQLEERPDSVVRVEIEQWSDDGRERRQARARFEEAVHATRGEFIYRSSIPQIAYEAALLDLPAAEVHRYLKGETRVTVRVMYDLNAFSHSLQGTDHSPLVPSKQSPARIRAYASVEFLEELAPLRANSHPDFQRIFDEYVKATYGRMIRPGNELVLHEVEAGRPLTRDEAMLSSDGYLKAINLLGEGSVDSLVADSVRDKTHKYAEAMNDQFAQIWQESDLNRDTIKGWFNAVENQLQSCGEGFFRRTDIDYRQLPHVRASILYLAVKHYQRALNGRQHDKGDLYDQRYLVESVTLGHLVTNDKDLKRTACQITDSNIVVYDLEEFKASMRL